ncbi:hypothetical protein [Celerinatantimonas sp. MCCC 1A17872]|uniref:hypothetical protein n=1 Tax=Celerinatantimonas sp. MCCC 1A17872 TaxID=3177514 RepID=UPI0038C981ED
MYEQVEKPKENESRVVANSVAQKKSDGKQGLGFVNNRPKPSLQHKILMQGDFVRPKVIQCYTVVTPTNNQSVDNWNATKDLRLADDGQIAVAQDSSYGSHDMWATAALITSANNVLKGKKSVMRLSAGGDQINGPAPDGTGAKTLVQVVPENVATKTKGTKMTLWADCGRSGRDIMGVGKGTGGNGRKMTGVYNKDRTGFSKFIGRSKERKTSASDPRNMSTEIYQSLGGKASYDLLSPDEKDAFDQKAGINRYAEPSIGEGYTMASGGAKYPGKTTWNFHWAGVVMVSGGDRVTLENFATGVAIEKNDKWDFQMYGPATKADQTFHDQHKAGKQHGQAPMTVPVKKR